MFIVLSGINISITPDLPRDPWLSVISSSHAAQSVRVCLPYCCWEPLCTPSVGRPAAAVLVAGAGAKRWWRCWKPGSKSLCTPQNPGICLLLLLPYPTYSHELMNGEPSNGTLGRIGSNEFKISLNLLLTFPNSIAINDSMIYSNY